MKLMQPLVFCMMYLFILFNCSSPKKSPYLTEQINHSTFQYKLEDRKLTDTLKVFDSTKKMVFFQDWENGKLKHTSIVDENGKIRHLEFYERKDSISTTQYYFDKNDISFKRYPLTKEIFEFYERHCFLSLNSISKDSINKVELFNYPIKHLALAVTNGLIQFEDEKFLIKTKLERGDTMKILLHNPIMATFTKEFHLIVK